MDEALYNVLPYRPCVGMAVFNAEGQVFAGLRIDGGEGASGKPAWQMPQGGIDKNELPQDTAIRELYEETSMTSVIRLAEMDDWLSYDIPIALAGRLWGGRYRGQKQRWFAYRFVGDEAEINIHAPAAGYAKPEFCEWTWMQLEQMPDLAVPFKRKVYENVAEIFSPYAQPTEHASG